MTRITPPKVDRIQKGHSANVPRTSQISEIIGCQNSSNTINATLLIKTYVLRSIGPGTSRVQNRLNPDRAIPVCCRPNRAIKVQFTTGDNSGDQIAPELIEFGTTVSQRNRAR